MAVTLQSVGVGSLGYPFYLADFAADTLPTPAGSDATLFVLETKQTLIWRNGQWQPFDDRQAATLAALRRSVDAAPTLYELLILRELRLVNLQLARSQGVPESTLPPVPELDGLTLG